MNKILAVSIIGIILLVVGFVLFKDSDVDETSENNTYASISSEQLKDMLEDKDFLLIDVHIPEQSHIPGTDLFIPYNDVNAVMAAIPDKDSKVAFYCRSGSMSKIISEELSQMGYNNIYELENGINEWKSQGNKVVDKI